MNNSFIYTLEKELKKKLPGSISQKKMAPESRDLFNMNISSKTKKSSIIILLYCKNSTWYTVLFQRPVYDGMHSGQVCFPGGKMEKRDNSLMETAIREAREEIGVDPENIKIIGELTSLYIPVSDYLVQPYIGYLDRDPVFVPDPFEVQDIITVPVQILIDPEIRKKKTVKFHGQNIVIPYFSIEHHDVWGATAMIISEFTDILVNPDFQHTDLYNADTAQ